MDQVNLGKTALGRPYHFNFFKGCLTQILLDPVLNTVSHKEASAEKILGPNPGLKFETFSKTNTNYVL